MKILHVITRLMVGGAQLNTLLCAAHQGAQGHDVTLIAGPQTGSEGSLWPQARRYPIRLVELPALVREPHPARDLTALWQLFQCIRRGRFDIVHTHTSKAGCLGRLAARAAGAPIVVHTPHGHVFHGYFSSRVTRFYLMAERWLAPLADRMVMLTPGCREDHLRSGVGTPEQLVIIPSGVNVAQFQQSNAEWQASASAELRVGTLARLVPIKGHRVLIEAFARLAQEFPQAQLLIGGDGPMRAELEQRLRQLGLCQRVTLLGHVDDVAQVLRRLDLFVLASSNEGMGRAVVEAMAAGLPVVATRVGGLPDLVDSGRTGLLVDSSDRPEQLAEAMATLLRDPQLRRSMGMRAREASWQWSEQVMFDRLDALYLELMRQKGRVSPPPQQPFR